VASNQGTVISRPEDRPKKVLFFFSLGFDVPSPSLHLMEAMVEDSLRAGWEVHVLASHTAGVYPDMPERLRSRPRLTWDIVSQPPVAKSAFVRRYLSGIKYAFDCLPRIHKVKGYDLTYVQSSPTALYNVLVAKACARRKPVIYSIQDMFPGSSIHSGVMTKPWMQRTFFLLQKLAYATADHITVISEDMKQRVIDQGVATEKVSVIVNWYDDREVREVPWGENRFVQAFRLQRDAFYVQYAGTMGYVFDYPMILSVAQILLDYADIEFQMIGDGSQRSAFELEACKNGLHNIKFYPLQSQALVGDVYSASSVSLIPLKRGVIGNSVPSKVALIMACNRTVVNSVDEDSEYYRMFHENHIGLSAPNTDPQAVARAVLELYNDKSEREALAENALEFSKEHYSRSVNMERLLALFVDLSRPRMRRRTREHMLRRL
jgi:glycosyltransferase involved in cell wall biosynthesis